MRQRDMRLSGVFYGFVMVCMVAMVLKINVLAATNTGNVTIKPGETKEAVFDESYVETEDDYKYKVFSFSLAETSEVTVNIETENAGEYHGSVDIDADNSSFTFQTGKQIELQPGNYSFAIKERLLSRFPANGFYSRKAKASVALVVVSKNDYVESIKRKAYEVDYELAAGESIDLESCFEGDTANAEWSCTQKDYCDLSKNGEFKAYYLGKYIVKAHFTDTDQTLKWTIYVISDKASVRVGKDKYLKDWTWNTKVNSSKWKSSNKSVAEIKNGKIVGKKKGKVILSCKQDGITYKLTVKVKPAMKQLTEEQKNYLAAATAVAIREYWNTGKITVQSNSFSGRTLTTYFIDPYGYEHMLYSTYYSDDNIKFDLVY